MTATTDGVGRTIGASFRDPGGFIFEDRSRLYRQVNHSAGRAFDDFIASGLYDRLVRDHLLIRHEERALASVASPEPALAHRIIEPERIELISYPYEWCFSQLKDAAAATLAIQKIALEHGHSLRDSSAFNIQFHRGRPVLIDSLSFEAYREGEPWVAYRQFCQHFLAPLALVARTDVRLGLLSRLFIDGVPLDLASRLLPGRTRLSPGLLIHIHLHARAQLRFAGRTAGKTHRVGRMALLGLIDSLSSAVAHMRWEPAGTEWADYYQDTNYTNAAMRSKAAIVEGFIDRERPRSVWDLGANTGVFSRLASARGIPTVAFDVDPAAVEKNYLQIRGREEARLMPLVVDLTNPSPALGWNHEERSSLLQRGPADMVLALALIHHLAISNNVPLERVARFLARAGRTLVVEFVPKSDSQVRRLLATREDIFPDYRQDAFEAAFSRHYHLIDKQPLPETERCMYLFRRREA